MHNRSAVPINAWYTINNRKKEIHNNVSHGTNFHNEMQRYFEINLLFVVQLFYINVNFNRFKS